MSLVEVIVAAAIMVLVFGGLMGSFQLMVSLVGKSKAEAGALALANERLEYIRSLAYADIGTVGGIPNGLLPQISTTTLNGVFYTERLLIQYVDALDDGEGAEDENSILADYKQVKVEYRWSNKGEETSISLISDIVPEGIETTAGGGTITVNVFDASIAPVANAAVHLYNNTGTTTIDTTRYTNVNGVAMFSGAPALASYELSVTKSGYSTDQTYTASSSNPNPTTPPVAVLESQVSTMNFQIDELSDLMIRTIGEPTIESFTDSFSDGSGISAQSNTEIGVGGVTLTGAPSYISSGTVRSVAVSPATFSAWDTVTFAVDLPTDTSVRLQVYSFTDTNGYMLVPDTDLPGNSSGFATGTVALAGLNPDTYPSLALYATLETNDASSTPTLTNWELSYTIDEPPIGSTPVVLTGAKTIGTTASATPVYKYQGIHTTDGAGEVTVSGLEWDVYDVTLGTSAYNIKEACANIPYILAPGMSDTLTLMLTPATAQSLRVYVQDIQGTAVAGASVTLTGPGFNSSDTTSSCGGAYFGTGLSADSDYTLTVSAGGYTTEVVTNVVVEGESAVAVTLNAP